jgi:hypothetical protein
MATAPLFSRKTDFVDAAAFDLDRAHNILHWSYQRFSMNGREREQRQTVVKSIAALDSARAILVGLLSTIDALTAQEAK